MAIDLVMCKMKHDEILHFEIYIKYLETYFSRAVKNNYSISVLSKGFETVENVSRTDSLPTWIVRIRQLMWRSWWRSSRPGWSVILWCSTMMIERPGPCGTAPCMMRRATSTGLRRFIARSAWWLHNTIATRPLRRQRGRSWKLWGQERPSQWGSGSELSRIFTPMSRLFCQGRRVISNICVFFGWCWASLFVKQCLFGHCDMDFHHHMTKHRAVALSRYEKVPQTYLWDNPWMMGDGVKAKQKLAPQVILRGLDLILKESHPHLIGCPSMAPPFIPTFHM